MIKDFVFRGEKITKDNLYVSPNVENNIITISIFTYVDSTPTIIGTIKSIETEGGYIVDTVSVKSDAQGKGIGTELYINLINILKDNGLSLYEDIRNTPQAKSVWNKLEKMGIAQNINNRRVAK